MAREDKPPALAQNKATLQIQIPLCALLSLHIRQSPTAPSPPRFCPTFSSSSLQKPMLRAPPWAAHRACKTNKLYMVMCGELLLCAHYVRRVMCDNFDYVRHSGPLCALTCAFIIIMCVELLLCAHYVRLVMCDNFDYVRHGRPLCAPTCAVILIMCGITLLCAHYVRRVMCAEVGYVREIGLRRGPGRGHDQLVCRI